MIPVICHRHGLRKAFCFIIDTTNADGIHISPIGFFLRVNEWIAIDFARTRKQESCILGFCQTQCFMRTKRTNFQGLNRISKIIHGRCWRCEMQNGIQFTIDIHIFGHIMMYEMKAFIPHQMRDIFG